MTNQLPPQPPRVPPTAPLNPPPGMDYPERPPQRRRNLPRTLLWLALLVAVAGTLLLTVTTGDNPALPIFGGGQARCLTVDRLDAARLGQRLVVVAEMTGTGRGDFTRAVRQGLSTQPDISVVQMCEAPSDSATARRLGERLDATSVLWGSFDRNSATLHLTMLKQPVIVPLTGDISLEPGLPDDYVMVIGRDHEAEMPYIAGMVGGHAATVSYDALRAGGLYESAIDGLPQGDDGTAQALLDANAAQAWLALGTSRLMLERDPASAIEAFDAAELLDSQNPSIYYNRGLAASLLGNSAALDDFGRAASLAPDWPAALNGRGAYYLAQDDLQAALNDFNQALALNPQYGPALNNRGLTHFAQENLQGAMSDFTTAIAVDETLAPAYKNRGDASLSLSDYAGALADFDNALVFNEFYDAVYPSRGVAHFELGHYRDAVNDFSAALVNAPEDPHLYFSRGSAHYEAGDFVSAISDFSAVIELQPDNVEALFSRANANFRHKNFAAAELDFNRALSLDPDNPEAYFLRGYVYHRYLNDPITALEDYTTAIDNGYAGADVYLNRGDLLLFQYAQLDLALADYQKAVLTDPLLEDAQRKRAMALYAAGDFSESARAWQAAVDVNAFNATHHAGLAVALEATGNHGAALEAYKQALRLSVTAGQANYLLGNEQWPLPMVEAAVPLINEAGAALQAEGFDIRPPQLPTPDPSTATATPQPSATPTPGS